MGKRFLFKKNHRGLWTRLAVFMAVILMAGMQVKAQITVTNTNDSGEGSLRQAIADAAGGATITFDSSLAGETIVLQNGELSIEEKSLTINGGDLGITLDAQNNSRIFNIEGSNNYVTISGIRMTNGNDNSWNGGGAIYVDFINLTLSCVTIENSYTNNQGGGFYASYSNVTILNSIIANNMSGWEGGGFCNAESTVTLIGCTLTGNHAGESGDGDAFYNDSGTVILKNCVVAGNDSGYEHYEIVNYDTVVAYYVITASGNLDSFSSYDNCLEYDSSRPLFVDAANGDYSLTSDSQAKDNGTNSFVTNPETATDLAGDSRIAFGTVDLGAYEYHAPLTSVAITGDANVGETLTASVSPNGASVSYQWYRGDVAISGATSASYTAVSDDAGYMLTVKAKGTGNYGGTVSETTSPVIKKETPSTVVTTLIDVVDVYDNLISIREAITYAGTGMLGTTVTFDSSLKNGTIYLEGVELSIAKSVTIDGEELGITLNAGKSSEAGSPTKTHTNRVVNIAGTNTSAIDVTLRALTITGGLENDGDGGGIYAKYTTLMIINSLVSDNAASAGGGISVQNVTLTITNSTIAGNTASSSGGGILAYNVNATLRNTIVANNTAATNGNDVYVNGTATLNAYNVLSSYSNWTAGSDNLVYDSSESLFVDAANGDYSLTSDSQAKNVGNNNYAAGISTDLAGDSRIAFETVDMGAYEYHTPLTDVTINGTAKIGETLTASVSPNGATVSYQWYRDGAAISGATSNSYTVVLADAGHTLTVKAKGTDDYGGTVSETTAEVPTIQLATPGNFAVTEKTDTLITVVWDEVENANGYSVEYKKAGEENWNVVSTSATSQVIDGLNRNTEYQLRVKAVGVLPYGDSEYATASVTTDRTALTNVLISGDAHIGQTLTASVEPTGATASYKWYRQGVDDPIWTDSTYSPVTDDIGYTLTVEATGTGDYIETVSATTAPVILPETPSTIVTTLEDVVELGDAKISLREAISYAGTGSCGMTITFDSSLEGGTIKLENGYLTIKDKSLTIDGGDLGITIDGQDVSRIFYISGKGAGVTSVTFSGFRMTNGNAPEITEKEGGAFWVGGCDVTLNGVTMDNCYAARGGGAFNAFNSNIFVLNSLIANNRSGDEGGAFYSWSSNVTLINSTLTGNYSMMDSDEPAGDCFKVFTFDDPATIELKNCIVVNNKAPGKNHSEIVRAVGALPIVINAYSILTAQNNINSSFNSCENCIAYNSTKPLFVDAANGDYSLTSDSQAKDKGNNSYVTNPETATDCAGWSRIAFETVDMGAYEYHIPITKVEINGEAKIGMAAIDEAKVGETLTAAVSPTGATASYQWYRAGEAISGATSASYTVVSDDNGYKLTVKAKGTGNYAGKVFSQEVMVTPPVCELYNGETFVGGYTIVQNAINAAVGDSIVMIFNSQENVTFPTNTTYVLNLNGYVLKGDGNGSVVTVEEGANLTISDSGSETTHYYTVGEDGLWTWNDASTAGAVNYEDLTARPEVGAIIALKGGAITGGLGSKCTGFECGGGVLVSGNGGNFTMNGGNVVGNTSSNFGGGISVGVEDITGTVEIEGGRIIGNKAISGGGIHGHKGSTLIVGDGDIAFNYSDYGGGIIPYATLSMTGGNVRYNYSNSGGGIYCDMGNISVTGGSITNNITNTTGGGVHITGCTLTLGGEAQINGNTLNGTTANNLYLPNGKTITISGDSALTEGANIGVTTQTEATVNNPIAFTSNGSATDLAYFHSDKADYSVIYENNSAAPAATVLKLAIPVAQVGEGEDAVYYSSINKALEHIGTGEAATIKLLQNTTEDVVITDENITLNLNGKTITKNSGNAITVNGGSLAINDETENIGGVTGNIALNGGTTTLNNGKFNGTITKSGEGTTVSITGGKYIFDPTQYLDIYHAAKDINETPYIYEVVGGDDVACNDGTRGFTTVQHAVDYQTGADTITMVNNSTENVTIAQGKEITLDLNGKTVTPKTDATFVIYNRGTLSLTDSSIAKTGTITGATDNGGGVQNYASGTLYMYAGTITGCTYGSINDGDFYMYGGTITGGTFGSINEGGNFYMYGGTITGNNYGVLQVGAMTIGGTAKITGNVNGEDKYNLFLPDDIFVFTVATGEHAPTTGMMVGVSISQWVSGDIVTVSTENTTDYSRYFVSDNAANNFVVYADKDDSYKLKITDDVKVMLTADPSDSGEVKLYYAGTTTEIDDPEHVHYGTEVTIKAIPKNGIAFKGWYDKTTGNMFSGKYEYTFTADKNYYLEARFTDQVIWIRVKK